MIKKLFLFMILSASVTMVSAESSIEFTVMHGPGGVSDITTRHLANSLDQNYNVVNRPGGSGRIALTHLLSEKTIMLATMIQVYVTNPLNFNNLGYDPFSDLQILSVVGVMPSALVCNKKTGLKKFEDFLTTNKKLTFGIGGYGSSEHLATATLFLKTKTDHIIIPYPQGGNRSISDVVGGHIDCMFANFPTVLPLLQNENLVLLMTSHDSKFDVPSWKTLYREDFPFQSYLSIITARSMPEELRTVILKDFKKNFTQSKLKESLKEIGLQPILSVDKNNLEKTENYMKFIKNFIIENQIKTSN